jgi:hypothetical protein
VAAHTIHPNEFQFGPELIEVMFYEVMHTGRPMEESPVESMHGIPRVERGEDVLVMKAERVAWIGKHVQDISHESAKRKRDSIGEMPSPTRRKL